MLVILLITQGLFIDIMCCTVFLFWQTTVASLNSFMLVCQSITQGLFIDIMCCTVFLFWQTTVASLNSFMLVCQSMSSQIAQIAGLVCFQINASLNDRPLWQSAVPPKPNPTNYQELWTTNHSLTKLSL